MARSTFLLCPPSEAAERIYDTLRGDAESVTVTTANGERYRAYRDGRGVTVLVSRAVVHLSCPREAAAYLSRLRSSETLGTADQRATLASLIESVVSL